MKYFGIFGLIYLGLKYSLGLKEVDARLQAEAAGGATLLKSIVIRLEDARILGNIDDMRKRLMQLKNINGDLIREHEIRLNSHRELAASLKELNIGVQRAARLRGNVFIEEPSVFIFISLQTYLCLQLGKLPPTQWLVVERRYRMKIRKLLRSR